MRILIIAPTMFFSDRGCHIRIFEQVNALEAMGHEPTVLTYHSGRDVGNMRVQRILRTPWYNKLVAGPSLHFIYMDVLLFLKCLRFGLLNRVDMIHAHLHEGAFIAQNLVKTKTFSKVPYLFDAQGSLSGEMRAHGFIGNESFSIKYWRGLERTINRRAPFIITSSSKLRDSMADDFNVSRTKILPVLDGVNIDMFKPSRDFPEDTSNFQRLRRKLGIGEDRIVVVYLGGMDRYKGIFHLVEAIPEVVLHNRKIHFLLMGYPGEERIREKTVELGVEKNVTVTGKIPYSDAPGYLALGDIAVAPKLLRWGESNGKLFTYMGCGLPVVVFDHEINREILGENGSYAKMGDTGSLAGKIIELANNSGKREHLGGELRKHAVENHSWLKKAARIEEIYKNMLNGSRLQDAK